MIQDIAPHRLDNAFAVKEAAENNVFFTFRKGQILVENKDGRIHLPVFAQLEDAKKSWEGKAVYAFSVDESPMFLLFPEDMPEKLPEHMEYVNPRELYKSDYRWEALAAVTAKHLDHWYMEHRFCGCCGNPTEHSSTERAKICPQCGNVQYPRISPVIMAAVTDGDRLLVTRYAGRPYKGLALIAGFVEIGESLEEALKREVMEEVGLEVKNLSYFGSQPWGFSDSIISGFFVELDGCSRVRLDRDELSEAIWLSREELPQQNTEISITAAMIEAFRKGER